MSDPQDDKRPFFREVHERQRFDVADLARRAGTHELTVLAMLRGHAVYTMQAEKVLRALSEMTGLSYTLKTVRILLKYPKLPHQTIPSTRLKPASRAKQDTTENRAKYFQRSSLLKSILLKDRKIS